MLNIWKGDNNIQHSTKEPTQMQNKTLAAAQIHLSAFFNRNFCSSSLLRRNPDVIFLKIKSYHPKPKCERFIALL